MLSSKETGEPSAVQPVHFASQQREEPGKRKWRPGVLEGRLKKLAESPAC